MVRVWMKALFAENEPKSASINKLEPVSIPERAGAFLLLGTAILIGLWPNILLTLIDPALHSPQFQPLWKGGLP
jgi:NADH-quinone oxidoreductase subunit M